MLEKTSFLSDVRLVLFSPRQFFLTRFLLMNKNRIHILGFLGVFLGLGIGSLINYCVSTFIQNDFLSRPEIYQSALSSLGQSKESFIELLKLQSAYSLLMGLLSPVIAYMAPHVFGGSLFGFLWLLVRIPDVKIDFHRVMECASISLASMIFYAVPIIGPFLALIFVALNLSRSLFQQYKIVGFMKAMSILSAIYICFFVSAATLQLLAEQIVLRFKL